MCDQTSTVTHAGNYQINGLSILGPEKRQGHIEVLRRVMTILLIISMHLFRVFDYKYNIEIMFLFSVMSCWLAVT